VSVRETIQPERGDKGVALCNGAKEYGRFRLSTNAGSRAVSNREPQAHGRTVEVPCSRPHVGGCRSRIETPRPGTGSLPDTGLPCAF